MRKSSVFLRSSSRLQPLFQHPVKRCNIAGGVRILNDEEVRWHRITGGTIDSAAQRERLEPERRERLYRDTRPVPDLSNRTVIPVDDGLANGTSCGRRSHGPSLIQAGSFGDHPAGFFPATECTQRPERRLYFRRLPTLTRPNRGRRAGFRDPCRGGSPQSICPAPSVRN